MATHAAPSAPKGFDGGDTFTYDGNIDSLPAWADKSWATYSRGPALAVPVGNPWGQPYTTQVARVGDTVFANKAQDRFAVVPSPTPMPLTEPVVRPYQESAASLEDLDAGGVLTYESMNEDAKVQMQDRGSAPVDRDGQPNPRRSRIGSESDKATPARKQALPEGDARSRRRGGE